MAVAQKTKMSNKSTAAQNLKPPSKPIVIGTKKAPTIQNEKSLRGKKGAGVKTPPVFPPKIAAKPPVVGAAQQIEKAKSALKKVCPPASATNGMAKAKAKAKNRKISVDVSPGEAASALAQKWATLYKKADQIDAKPYNMTGVFEEKMGLIHKVLGWGYILANRNDRLEVLFKDGIKYLISNYKP